MSAAAPMGWARRLDNYEKQIGSETGALTSRQDRRFLHKERKNTGTDGGVWIAASRAKNRPTRRAPQNRRGPRQGIAHP